MQLAISLFEVLLSAACHPRRLTELQCRAASLQVLAADMESVEPRLRLTAALKVPQELANRIQTAARAQVAGMGVDCDTLSTPEGQEALWSAVSVEHVRSELVKKYSAPEFRETLVAVHDQYNAESKASLTALMASKEANGDLYMMAMKSVRGNIRADKDSDRETETEVYGSPREYWDKIPAAFGRCGICHIVMHSRGQLGPSLNRILGRLNHTLLNTEFVASIMNNVGGLHYNKADAWNEWRMCELALISQLVSHSQLQKGALEYRLSFLGADVKN